ncbi:MAG: alpha/beta hydrolase, partial [Cyanothece sp. SIO1E1]|nr:alpha/beta hydrolase [Cyanothece sp. SIO1E1]
MSSISSDLLPQDQSSPIHPWMRFIHQKRGWIQTTLGVWMASTMMMAGAALGAERLFVSFGPLERSIAIEDLEVYAQENQVTPDLAIYTRFATSEQLADLQDILLTPAEIDLVALSQFLYTDQGEILLRRLGRVIQPGSRLSGFFGIRGALILAAGAQEGLTLLNVLQQFPTPEIRIDLSQSVRIAEALGDLINQTNAAADLVERQ